MAAATYKAKTYPLKLNKRESKVVETSVEAAKDEISGSSPGGNEKAIQYNDGSDFAGSDEFKWNNSEKAVNLNGLKFDVLSDPFTLQNNQSNAATIFSFAHASTKYMILEYSIDRDGENRIGHLKVVTNGSTVSLDDIYINTADVGVDFEAEVSGANINIKYTSTDQGAVGTLKYSRRRWI